MAKCWTCGASVSGYKYTCGSCRTIGELQDLNAEVEGIGGTIETQFENLIRAQTEAVSSLGNQIETGLNNIASAIEWGFDQLSWRIAEQTAILRGIDATLKTPSQTQANEYRLMATELLQRGVIEDAKSFFKKALELNPLDYRIYVGFARSHLRASEFDEAQMLLEKSLPHAPKDELDYRSYSYRLIGHIYECKEDYSEARKVLDQSLDLSPRYADGLYDSSKYNAFCGDTRVSAESLERAIREKPLCWNLAQKDAAFDSAQPTINNLLASIYSRSKQECEQDIAQSRASFDETNRRLETLIGQTESVISRVVSDTPSKDDVGQGSFSSGRPSIGMFETAKKQFSESRGRFHTSLEKSSALLQSHVYSDLLEGGAIARSARGRLKSDAAEIEEQLSGVSRQASEDIKRWKSYVSEELGEMGGYAPCCGLVGGIIGAVIGGGSGFFLGGVLGLLFPFVARFIFLKIKEGS